MVRIRLRRVGAKKQPHYRVVVADQRSPRDGRHVEVIGFYNPRTEPETVEIKEDRALYWLSNGAKPSEVVLQMLEKQGTIARLARLHAGESIEALVAEYEAEAAEETEEVESEGTLAEAQVATEVEPAQVEEETTEPAGAEEETVAPEGTLAEAQVGPDVTTEEETEEPATAGEATVEPEGTVAEATLEEPEAEE